MAVTRVVVAKAFSVGVVAVVLLVGAFVLAFGGFSESGLLLYLLTLSFALAAAQGIWTDRYVAAAVGTLGMVGVAAIQGAFVVGLAALLVVAFVLGWSGRNRGPVDRS